MKKKSRKRIYLLIPPSTHALLKKACAADVMRPTLGQMVTKLAYDKYGHLAEGNGGSAVVNPEAMEMAQQLWAESGGDKTHAMAAIPVGHPLKIELVRAIEKLASRRM